MDYNSSDSADSRRLEGIEAYVCGGKAVSREDALFLAGLSDIDALCDAADCIRRMFAGNAVDSCSIVNARRGFAPKTANGVRRLRATIQAAMSTTI